MNSIEKNLDALFVVPSGNKKKLFQGLADLTAIEPPSYAGLFVNYLRQKGFNVNIIDAPALNLSPEEVADEVAKSNPHLVIMIVYGHQPSASTQNMPAAGETCKQIKSRNKNLKIIMTGVHPTSLPERTLREEAIDFVCEGEGPITFLHLINILKSGGNLNQVPGLWYWENDNVKSTPPPPIIDDLDKEFSGICWDLLPMKNYRAHNWHCFDDIENRSPYAAIHTSFGCPFGCIFCCINAPFGRPCYRMFSPDYVMKEIDILVNEYGVKNIKFIDELFVLSEEHVVGICDKIIERGYDLNIWAYARVDTTDEKLLGKLRQAGIRWLALGIESGSKHVRDGTIKKRFSNIDINEICKKIQEAGIYICANYIFGLSDDSLETMQETLDMALEINAEWANFYSAMAYPGSPLYRIAKEKKLPLPDDPGGPGWIGYSQHAYETMPLPTDTLPASEVLRFRDKAFITYFTDPNYLKMIEKKFGQKVIDHINQMLAIPLKRKLLGQ